VRLYAGVDPVTGKQVYLRATIDGTDDKVWRQAEDKLSEFRTQVLRQRSASSSVTLSYALDEWMRVSELEESTSNTYAGYITRTIVPALGHVPIKKIDARTLESFYTELRRCRVRCAGKPFIEKHKSNDEGHDCAVAECKPHTCRPMAASTVRQIHGILSGTLGAAERWDWIASTGTHRTSPEAEGSRARPADTGRGRQARQRGVPDGRRLGHPRLARHDDRYAPRRTGRPAILAPPPRRRGHRPSPQLGTR
jgi:hypothetical protein